MGKIVTIEGIRSIDNLQVEIDSRLVIIAGMNGTGKSTVLECIENALMMKGFEKEAIQNGRQEGSVVYVSQDQGTITTVEIITKQTGSEVKMTITDPIGKTRTVRELGEARRILGNYINYSPDDIINMTMTAEGRRKFTMEILFRGLDAETKARLLLLENSISSKRNKDTAGNLYSQRTEVISQIKILEASISNAKKDNPNAKYVGEKENIQNAKAKRVQERHDLELEMISITNLYNQMHALLDHYSYEWKQNILDPVDELYKKLDKMQKVKEDLDTKITNATNILNDIALIEQDTKRSEENLKNLTEARNKEKDLSAKIEKAREEIKEIYTKANLPGGIEILTNEDGDLDFLVDNGKDKVHVNQLSEGQLHYLILEILMRISTSEMINIGNVDIYDTTMLNKILALAEKNNRLLLAEKVTDSEELEIFVR